VTIVEVPHAVAVTPIWQSNATQVAVAALQTLPAHTQVPVPYDVFHIGAFVRDADWQVFLQAAQFSVAPAIAPGQAAIFFIFDGRHDALSPIKIERTGNTLTFTIEWMSIEQDLGGVTPALLYVVDRTDIARVRVRTRSELGTFLIPAP